MASLKLNESDYFNDNSVIPSTRGSYLKRKNAPLDFINSTVCLNAFTTLNSDQANTPSSTYITCNYNAANNFSSNLVKNENNFLIDEDLVAVMTDGSNSIDDSEYIPVIKSVTPFQMNVPKVSKNAISSNHSIRNLFDRNSVSSNDNSTQQICNLEFDLDDLLTIIDKDDTFNCRRNDRNKDTKKTNSQSTIIIKNEFWQTPASTPDVKKNVSSSNSSPQFKFHSMPMTPESVSISPKSSISSPLTFKEYKTHCNICNKNFKRASSLKTHINIHSGIRPFKCPYGNCSKSFTAKSNMRRHYKLHFRLADGTYILPNGQLSTRPPLTNELFPKPEFF